MFSRHLVIDTDIGTDVDDAVALIQILASERKSAVSITTVYGDVQLRAQIAENYCRFQDEPVDIYPGASKTLSGREVWKSCLEGSLHKGLGPNSVFANSAQEFFSNISHSDNVVNILAIAPLTNLANAIANNSNFEKRVQDVFLMGGRFADGRVEHNILSDVTAAQKVFNADLRISVVGIEITSQVKIDLKNLSRIEKRGPAASLLVSEIIQWANFRGQDWIEPHDSIAYLMFHKPEIFEFSSWGHISISDDGKTTFEIDVKGRHRFVTNIDVSAAKEAIFAGIEGVKFRS
jgi:inosine-uridine nucleoside N-ribohydrolase